MNAKATETAYQVADWMVQRQHYMERRAELSVWLGVNKIELTEEEFDWVWEQCRKLVKFEGE